VDLELKDKVVLVSGSSRGIGFAIARAFLKEGAIVVITGRDEGSLVHARDELLSLSSPDRVLAIRADMTNPAEIQNTIDQITSRSESLYALVANVGTGVGKMGWDLTPDEWQLGLQQNLLGNMALATAALPHFVSHGTSSITFISSIVGIEAVNAPLPYSAAKAALNNVAKNLARTLGGNGVRVNVVAPGNVLVPGGSWEKKLMNNRDTVEQYIRSEVPARRFGRPEEIADAVVFLASERASFITGSCLVVDGGQSRSY
jgi:3-oxoacyl-[acyl-carrier protein] reductase